MIWLGLISNLLGSFGLIRNESSLNFRLRLESLGSLEGDKRVATGGGEASIKLGLKSGTGTLGRSDSKMSLPIKPTPTSLRCSKNDLSSNFGIGEGNGVDERSGEVAIVGVDGVANPKVLTGGKVLKIKMLALTREKSLRTTVWTIFLCNHYPTEVIIWIFKSWLIIGSKWPFSAMQIPYKQIVGSNPGARWYFVHEISIEVYLYDHLAV